MVFKETHDRSELKELPSVKQVCDELQKQIACDFVGLAMQDKAGPDVRWHYASGNLNDKYKRITVRFGKGIAGKIISSGSSMLIEEFPNNIAGKVTDYPIFLAEKLVSTYAVPLFIHAVPKGVLLVGKRAKYIFLEKEQELVQESALVLEQLLKGHMLRGRGRA